MIGLWKVAVDAPLSGLLSYSDESLSSEERQQLAPGILVNVPLGTRAVLGLIIESQGVLDLKDTTTEYEIKSIRSIDKEHSRLNTVFLNWLTWLSNYYIYPLGQLIGSVYPPLGKELKSRKSRKAPVVPQLEMTKAPQLTEEQTAVVNAISTKSGFNAHLVFGVTGSGKTEIYMQLLEQVLASGKSGLVIVPEISLTPQLTHRFVSRFGDQVGVLHSQLTHRERTNQWWQVIAENKKILVGARSSLFCPIKNLGIIIVDEEHEPSFKQDEKLKYHGRDAAVMRAYMEKCPIVLGSATPSLESWKNALEKKYELHRLAKRVENRAMPLAQIVDLKLHKESRDKNPEWMPHWMSRELYMAMYDVLQNGQQVALFLNRRGFANIVLCPSCGFVKECPNCDISLTLHGKSHLVCHYCDYREDLTIDCSNCQDGEFLPQGLGTEQVAADVERLFPGKRVARADRDEIENREDLESLIEDMEKGNIDILVGTQMIAKGLDFPNLNLVGIVLADIGLNMPDFRSSERSFQLITQVSGRAGRHVKPGDEPGKVIIQTYNPEHFSIQLAAQADFETFAQQELEMRKELNYPPYGRLVSFRIQGTDLDNVKKTVKLLAGRCKSLSESREIYQEVEILGPSESPLFKLRNQYRFQLMLKGPKADVLNSFVRQILGNEKWVLPKCRLLIDVDPLAML